MPIRRQLRADLKDRYSKQKIIKGNVPETGNKPGVFKEPREVCMVGECPAWTKGKGRWAWRERQQPAHLWAMAGGLDFTLVAT